MRRIGNRINSLKIRKCPKKQAKARTRSLVKAKLLKSPRIKTRTRNNLSSPRKKSLLSLKIKEVTSKKTHKLSDSIWKNRIGHITF